MRVPGDEVALGVDVTTDQRTDDWPKATRLQKCGADLFMVEHSEAVHLGSIGSSTEVPEVVEQHPEDLGFVGASTLGEVSPLEHVGELRDGLTDVGRVC